MKRSQKQKDGNCRKMIPFILRRAIMNQTINMLKNRRSIYNIGKYATISDKRLQLIIEEVTLHTPSAFNCQSDRILILLNQYHDDLWDIVYHELQKIVPPDAFPHTEKKLASFQAGHGTILFFEDRDVIEDLKKKFPLYKDNFDTYSMQSNGMLQLNVWLAMQEEGLGASLQHYNPLIDEEVQKRFHINPSWRLVAQMPFGEILGPAAKKDYLPADERVMVLSELRER